MAKASNNALSRRDFWARASAGLAVGWMGWGGKKAQAWHPGEGLAERNPASKDTKPLFNRPRAIEFMRQYGLDVLVATSAVNVTYFTDYSYWADPIYKEYMSVPGGSSNLASQLYAVFPLEGEPAVVVNAGAAAIAADLWVRDLHVYGDPTLDFSLPPTSATPLENRLLT